jgi:hypothetical protein
MRTVCKAALLLGIAALLAGPAAGAKYQYHGRGGGFLLLNKSVQQELKMDKGQVDKVIVALHKVRDGHKADFARLRDRNLPPEQRAALAGKVAHASRQGVKGILRPEQAQRFRQIRLQLDGVHAFLSPRTQKALKVTDAQKAEFQAIAASFRAGQQAIFGSAAGHRQEAFKKVTALRAEKMDAALKVLTDGQKKAWKEMTGAPFHIRFAPRHTAA